MNIVCMHGFGDTGFVFSRLQRRLAAAGHRCFMPTLHPRDGRLGLVDLAHKLAAAVDAEFAPAEPLAFVGFSMGCLVTRYYLQNLRDQRPIPAFFALSGPMRGTWTAYFYPGKGARDMRPGSRFLRELDAQPATLKGIPLHTYYTPLDLMILPATSSRLAGATELRVWALLHPLVLIHRQVGEDLCRQLGELEKLNLKKAVDS